ncbi:TetR/AcrR family transcriptional regulator [Kribbella sp. NPDC056861]|uniref:TetR/AcrR family transcriptional regulator n=1 Tax=Kribbella sp. NPDC056861 TaxID=3154857 RepID=UPI003424477D
MATGRPRDPRRDEAILGATRELLSEKGYAQLSIEAVAARSGTAKSSIYRRWDGKEQLVVAALQAHVEHDGPAPATGSLRGDLLVHCRRLADNLTRLDRRLVLGLAEAKAVDPGLAESLDQQFPGLVRLTPTVAHDAIERGELPLGSTTDLADEIATALLLSRFLHGAPLDEAYLAHLVDDVALPALAASSG